MLGSLLASAERQTPFEAQDLGISAAYHLYHYGMSYPEGYCIASFREEPHKGEKLFRDAEDYLVQLDGASEKYFANLLARWWKAKARMTEAHGTPQPPQLQGTLRGAKRIVAAECVNFLRGVSDSTLGPYRRWAKKLDPSDSIITFNYDRVLETIRPGTVDIVGIGEERPDYPKLYKMHGSVDWVENGQGIESPTWHDATVAGEDYDPLIGIPGRTKDGLAGKALKALWVKAGTALREAEMVHIIGYSLPESDSLSREWLLTNLQRNRTKDLLISIALGRPGPHTERLEAILRQTLRHRPDRDTLLPGHRGTNPSLFVDIRPLYAQDTLDCMAIGQDPH